MASDFIGVQMLVTLIDPPGIKLKGTVSAVEARTGLTLSNGACLTSRLSAFLTFTSSLLTP
jgi:hypothetical protein